MNDLARLLVPALRWDRSHGFRYLEGLIDDALELGVGGFVIAGGPCDESAALIRRLHRMSQVPLLIAVRAESGAGETIEGLTHLPPFAALTGVAVVGPGVAPALDPEPIRRAARITARELRNLGANWALAPNCVAGEGIAHASDDPAIVSAVVGEWVDACQAESVIATAMSCGATATSPIVAAVEAGASCVMAASTSGIERMLRDELQFDGMISTRPFTNDAAITPQNEASVAVESVIAGCDLVLAPGDLNGVADALEHARATRVLDEQRVRAASERVMRWSGWGTPSDVRERSLDDVMWSRQLADAALRWFRGTRPHIGASVEVAQIGACTDGADAFSAVLRAMHIDVRRDGDSAAGQRDPLLVLFSPSGADLTRDEVARIQARSATPGRDVVVVAFCAPASARAILGATALLCAWEPSRPMQEAAARAMFGRAT